MNVCMHTEEPDPAVQSSAEPVDRADPAISTQPGAGSLTKEDEWVSSNHQPMMNDDRSDTKTTFYYWDTDSAGPSQKHRDDADRRSWSDLAKINDGLWSSDRKQRNFDADVRRWIDTFCSSVPCTSYHHDRVVYVIDSIDLGSIRQHRFPSEHIILATISLVVDEDTRVDPDSEWSIMDDWIVYSDAFQSLMSDIDMDMDALWNARQLVREESETIGDTDGQNT